jgi:hypothetical protein
MVNIGKSVGQRLNRILKSYFETLLKMKPYFCVYTHANKHFLACTHSGLERFLAYIN